jgi:hypothetical protein
MLCAMVLTGLSTVFTLLGIPFNHSTPGILTVGIMGSICAGSIWFAFFPPVGYVSWIRSRAGIDAATAPSP